jgi:hypothetical protein
MGLETEMKPESDYLSSAKKMPSSLQTPTLNNQSGGSIHGHHRMANTETKPTIYWAEDDREALFSQ